MLTAIPATAETRLSFAALADLLGPVLADVLTEPAARRSGARSRSRCCSTTRLDLRRITRAVAFAFLTAVRALAREGPVVVAIDDIQWLDGPSAFMVEFAIRRLRDEPVVFLLALRTGEGAAPLGLERALPEDGLRRLHDWAAQPGRSSPPPERAARPGHLAAEAAANPASSQVGTRCSHSSWGERCDAARSGWSRAKPCRARSQRLVRDRLMLLPQETRAALLAASALSQPTLALVGGCRRRRSGATRLRLRSRRT